LICKGILAVLLPINVPINCQVGSKPSPADECP
jgi:hypothetical protein